MNVVSRAVVACLSILLAGHLAHAESLTAAGAENAFGIISYKKLAAASPNKNLFFSPLSLHSCLQLASNGATGETAKEMRMTLDLEGISPALANAEHMKLLESLSGKNLRTGDNDDRPFVLSVANSIWADKAFSFNPQFVETCKKFFSAEVKNLDFRGANGTAAINSWVSEKTNGKIKQIVDSLNPENPLVLLNTAYFRARWQHIFPAENTAPKVFQVGPSAKKVPMMRADGRYQYLETATFQAIELPYEHCRNSMIVLLPKSPANLNQFTQGLSEKEWNQWLLSLAEKSGEIEMPKFSMSYEVVCNQMLEAQGMKRIFSDKAELTNMLQVGSALDNQEKAPSKSPCQAEDHLPVDQTTPKIDKVLHKTFVSVDEQGTEAAAATATIGRGLSMPHVSSEKFKMIIDHPFMFVIVNRETGAILFIGQVNDPMES